MPQPLPKHRARDYETVFILNPDTPPEGIEQIAGRVTEVIERLDGKLMQAENWGKRRLAYPVRKHPKGYYVYLRYLGYADVVHELERNLRMLEPVLKYLTVKLDEDVDPTARPVKPENISFLPKFEEVPEREYSSSASHAVPSGPERDEAGDRPGQSTASRARAEGDAQQDAVSEDGTEPSGDSEPSADPPDTSDQAAEDTEETEI